MITHFLFILFVCIDTYFGEKKRWYWIYILKICYFYIPHHKYFSTLLNVFPQYYIFRNAIFWVKRQATFKPFKKQTHNQFVLKTEQNSFGARMAPQTCPEVVLRWLGIYTSKLIYHRIWATQGKDVSFDDVFFQ